MTFWVIQLKDNKQEIIDNVSKSAEALPILEILVGQGAKIDDVCVIEGDIKPIKWIPEYVGGK